MRIASIRHKGLRQLYENNDPRGVPASSADKIRKLLFAMETAEGLDELTVFPGWRLHRLNGNFNGLWSLSVTGNWRIISKYEEMTNTASILDLVDYH